MSDAPAGADPFSPSGTAGYFVTPALAQRLDLIEHLLEFGRQIVVVSGATGAGKSTLLSHLALTARDGWYCIRVHGGPTLGARALTALVAREIDVEQEADGEPDVLLAAVRQRAATLARAGKLPVLLVDDADELGPEALAMLVRFAHADRSAEELRVVLAANLADSALLDSVQSERAGSGPAHVVEIPALGATEVSDLVTERMASAGRDAAERFDAVTLREIAAASGGNPGKILALARQHLARQSAPPRNSETRSPRWAAAGRHRRHGPLLLAVVVLLALGGWWIGRGPGETRDPTTIDVELPGSGAGTAARERDSANAPSPGEDGSAPASDPAPDTVGTSAIGPDGRPAPGAGADSGLASGAQPPSGAAPSAAGGSPGGERGAGPPDPPPVGAGDAQHADGATSARDAAGAAKHTPAAPDPLSGEQRTGEPPAIGPSPADAEPAARPLAVPAEPVAGTPSPPATVQADGGESAVDEALHESERARTAAIPARTPATATTAPRAPSAPAVTAGPARAPAARAPAAIADYSYDWLMKQPRSAYALQLLGVRDGAAARRFLTEHGLGGRGTVVSTRRDGEPWHVVLYGYYPTRAAATAAARELGSRVRGVEPWPRTIESLAALER